MSTVHVMVGIPGSGKSTYSNTVLQPKLQCLIVTSDGIRQEHPDWDEPSVWAEVYRRIANELANNRDVIFDATSCTPRVRARLFERINELIPNVSYKAGAYYFPTPSDICFARIEKRNQVVGEHFFPLDALQRYADTISEPTTDEGYDFIETIICY